MKRYKRRKACLLSLLLVLCITAGCHSKQDAVVIPRASGPLLQDSFRAGVATALAGGKVRMRWRPASWDRSVEDQLGTLQEIVGSSRGIILLPEETLASRSLILQAVRQGTPVVVVGDEFGPPPSKDLSYVMSDENEGARIAAEHVAHRLRRHGTVAVVGINPRQEASLTREVQFERWMQALAPDVHFVLRQWGDAVVTHQQFICEKLLQDGKPPDAIIALSAAATRGALYAKLTRPAVPHTILVGFDQDDPQMLLPIATGEVDAVVAQDAYKIGERAGANLRAAFERRTVPFRTEIPPLLVTRNNVEELAASVLVPKPTGTGAASTTRTAVMQMFAPARLRAGSAFLREDAKQHALRPDVQPIGNFIRLPGKHPGITVQGTVVSPPPMLEVQDETSSVLVSSFTASRQLRVGDVVRVHGNLTSERFRSSIAEATLTVLWSGDKVAPLAVTAMELTQQYRGESIEVEGVVLQQRTMGSSNELVLQDGTQTFRALLYSANGRPTLFPIGSRIRLRGTATSIPQITEGLYPFTVIATAAEQIAPPPWWTPLHVSEALALTALVLLGINLSVHRLHRWRMQSVMREREQLAFEMHDTLAQSFTGIAYQLHAARTEQGGKAVLDTHLEHALQMVEMSHREASRTIASLRPQHRDAPGILQALQQSAERLCASGVIDVHTVLAGGARQLPLAVTEAFFRIGQEAISNAIQHGRCTRLCITLFATKRMAVLTVEDNGVGFFCDAASQGLGITSMRRRAEEVRAKCEIQSAPGQGAQVCVTCHLTSTSGLLIALQAKLPDVLRRKTTEQSP